ncbi:MAG: thioredoxin family protein [Muribaculaceae bacterium]|nr:thioredoxin family protein [Muribaculaceae bacterium]
MNKIMLACGVAAIISLASCSTDSTKKAEEANAVEVEKTEQADVTLAPVATDGKVIELDNASLVAPGVKVSQLTVLDFNAVWCGPCRQLTPVLEEMAKKYEGKVTFVSIDVDKFGDLFEAYNLGSSIPAVVFIRPDGQTKNFIGTGDLLPASAFEALIEANL